MTPVRIAVAGAGLIGRRHIEEIAASGTAALAAIVDPFDAADEVAARYSVPRYATLAELFAAGRPDGVILATPNQLHVDGGLECVAAGVPVIVEKPIGDTVESATRGFAVEDTAAMIFTFANGALGTFVLSDTAASPRSWEQTSGENTSYDSFADEDCYHITGTRGSLSVPTMRLRVYEGERSWWAPLTSSVVDVDRSDPLANQITHFAAVIRGEEAPVCSGRDGLKTLKVVDAVVEAARTGRPVDVTA